MILGSPIMFGAAVLATAAFGEANGFEVDDNKNQAKEIGEYAQARYKSAVRWLKAYWEATKEVAQEYSQLQLNVKQHTIEGFITFVEQICQQASQSDMTFLAGLEGISVQHLKEYQAAAGEAEQFFQGDAVLKDTALSSALAIGDLILAGEGEKALTKAREYEATVNTAITKIVAAGNLLLQIQQHLDELGDLVSVLDERAAALLNELKFQPFEPNRDASKFQELALLVKSLVQIMKPPILDPQGNLNYHTTIITANYRNLEWN